LAKATNQTVTMSNKRKINLEETKENYDNNFMNEVQMGIEGGENIINGGKIPNKYFANKYKVTIEKGIKNTFLKSNNINNNTHTQNLQNSNSSYQNNSSAMINNSQLNPFAHLPTELASSFDKMITQLEIITKTMKIMSQRIQTVEGQVEELYNMRRMTSTMNNNIMENNQNIFNQNLSNENSHQNQINQNEIVEDNDEENFEDNKEEHFDENEKQNFEENEKEEEHYEIPRDENEDEILEPNENNNENPVEVFEDKENEEEDI
jgi:hypothetical protein